MSIQGRIIEALSGHRLCSETFTASDGNLSVRILDDEQIARRVADILAAELFPAVTTIEELDALPTGTIIRAKGIDGGWQPAEVYRKDHDGWSTLFSDGSGGLSYYRPLGSVVLWTPGAL